MTRVSLTAPVIVNSSSFRVKTQELAFEKPIDVNEGKGRLRTEHGHGI